MYLLENNICAKSTDYSGGAPKAAQNFITVHGYFLKKGTNSAIFAAKPSTA